MLSSKSAGIDMTFGSFIRGFQAEGLRLFRKVCLNLEEEQWKATICIDLTVVFSP